MNDLAKRISLPLEREYEAWIVDHIERYFKRVGAPVDIFAISPSDERTWPADEAIDSGGKIVGLQFKRPTLAPPNGPNDFSRLHWDLSKPRMQFQRVAAHQELFYCLPTFVNRDVRRQALDHCLFWRPEQGGDHRAWYDNPDATTQYQSICNAPRWGLFAERFIRCTIGHRLNGQRFSDYLTSLKSAESPNADEGAGAESVIQMIVLRREPGN